MNSLIKTRERMEPVMIRIPPGTRQRIKEIITAESLSGKRLSESDVYRAAIDAFLLQYFTISKADELRRGESEGSN